jgi:hypothetical protein
MHDAARIFRRRQPERRAATRRWAPILVAAVAAAVALVWVWRSGEGARTADTTKSTAPSAPLLMVDPPAPTVPATLEFPPGYELDDTRDVHLRPAIGEPAGPPDDAVPMTGGSAVLSGVVNGPDGPVGGATVRLERFVGERVGRADHTAGADGRFQIGTLPGGRYRIRAWSSAASLAGMEAATAFLAAEGGRAQVTLAVERHSAITMAGAFGARQWQVGHQAGVSVRITQEYVDGDGIVRVAGRPGAKINLQVPPGLASLAASSAVTGADGYAEFGVECRSPGDHRLIAESSGYTRAIEAPRCTPPPPPTTPAPSVPGPGPGPSAPAPTPPTRPISSSRCELLACTEERAA